MSQATGRVTVKLNGDVFGSMPGASIDLGGIVREPVVTDQGDVRYRESTKASEIKATLVHVAALDLHAIRSVVDGVGTFETDTGVVYTVRGCFCKDMGELVNGEVEVILGGAPAEPA